MLLFTKITVFVYLICRLVSYVAHTHSQKSQIGQKTNQKAVAGERASKTAASTESINRLIAQIHFSNWMAMHIPSSWQRQQRTESFCECAALCHRTKHQMHAFCLRSWKYPLIYDFVITLQKKDVQRNNKQRCERKSRSATIFPLFFYFFHSSRCLPQLWSRTLSR